MPSIKLRSSHGEMLEVGVETDEQFVIIKTILEDLGMDEGGMITQFLHQMSTQQYYKRSFSGVPTTRMTLLFLRTLRAKESKQMIPLFGTENS